MIPVGSWQPDIADTNAGVATQALNVLLLKDGNGIAHAPMPGLSSIEQSQALPDDPRGGVSVVDAGGSYSCVVGTATALYRLQSDYSWSALGTGYGLLSGERWSFARHGDGLYCTNRFDGMRRYDVELGGVPAAITNAPKARYVFTWLESLFALDCDGDNRLMRYTAAELPSEWKVKGAGSQSFYEGEELMCGVGLTKDIAIVWQRNAISMLVRQNSGTERFLRQPLYSGRGCVNPAAMCAVDGMAFFMDTSGPYMIGPDGQLNNIGENKISRTFLARLASDALDTIELAVDKVNSRVIFRYKRESVSSDTVFQDCIAFNYVLGEWSEISMTSMAIFSMATPSVVLDNMASFGPMDSIDIPLDSRFWAGKAPRIAALDENRKFAFFDGDNLASISETGSTYYPQSVLVRSVTPLTDCDSATVQVGVRDRIADDIVWKDGVAMQPSGRCPVRARGKVVAFRHITPVGADWAAFRGFDGIEASSGGPR